MGHWRPCPRSRASCVATMSLSPRPPSTQLRLHDIVRQLSLPCHGNIWRYAAAGAVISAGAQRASMPGDRTHGSRGPIVGRDNLMCVDAVILTGQYPDFPCVRKRRPVAAAMPKARPVSDPLAPPRPSRPLEFKSHLLRLDRTWPRLYDSVERVVRGAGEGCRVALIRAGAASAQAGAEARFMSAANGAG